MTPLPLYAADRSLEPAECWSLLARTPSARLVHGALSPVSVLAVDRHRKRVTVDIGATAHTWEHALLEIGDQGPVGGWNVIAVVGTAAVKTVPRSGVGASGRRLVLEIVEVGGLVFASDARRNTERAVVTA